MKYKKSIMILMLAIFLLSISSVYAMDLDDTSIASDDSQSIDVVQFDGTDDSHSIDVVQIDDVDDTAMATDDSQSVGAVQIDGIDEEATVNDDVKSIDAGDEIISEGEDSSSKVYPFSNLQMLIDSYDEGAEIDFDEDFLLSNGEDPIQINKSITLNGNGHSLDANHLGRIINITADGKNITFKNIKFVKGGEKDRNEYINVEGGAIFNDYSSTSLTLINCEFHQNGAHLFGGAVYSKGDITINDCQFLINVVDGGYLETDEGFINYAAGNGGAVYSLGNIFINNTYFIDNQVRRTDDLRSKVLKYTAWLYYKIDDEVSDGGTNEGQLAWAGRPMAGGAVYSDKECTVYNSNFVSNRAGIDFDQVGTSGGAIYSVGNINVTNSTFMDNSANDWGGGAIFTEGNCIVYNSTFEDNTANKGGAIYCPWGETQVYNSDFEDNRHIVGSSWLEANDLVGEILDLIGIPANPLDTSEYFASEGGAIYSKKCYVESCTFEDNYASEHGGAIYCTDDLTVTGENSFVSNEAFRTSGGFFSDLCDWTVQDNDGGAIYCEGNANISGAIFRNNDAVIDGGAIYCKKKITLNNSVFDRNSLLGKFARKSYGGAIYTNTLDIAENCNFTENAAWPNETGAFYPKGGAVFINKDCTAEFISCIFENNKAGDSGGAIRLDGSGGHLKVSNCTFEGNKVGIDGGAIYCVGETTVSDSRFITNQAKNNPYDDERSKGGAILSYKLVSVNNCNFTRNHANNLGGAIYCKDGNVIINGSNFTDNSAKEGGAVYAHSVTQVSNSVFYNNNATDGEGGAVYINNHCDPTFSSCIFEANECTGRGGAIHVDGYSGTVKLADSLFKDNVAGKFGGAIFTNYEDAVSYTVTEITNCNFTGNHAKDGGAVYTSQVSQVSRSVFVNNNATDGEGGAVYINNHCDPTFTSCIFEANRCTGRGGAILVDGYSGTVKLADSLFKDNVAGKFGGAIFANYENAVSYTVTEITNCNFTGNSAKEGGAAYTSRVSQVSNSVFIKNNASNGNGGSLYINNKCNPTLSSCIFNESTCTGKGGAVYLDSGDAKLKVSDSTFARNTAKDGGAIFAHIITQVSRSVFVNNNATDGEGGAIHINNHCDPTFTSCIFEANRCTGRGGAILVDGYSGNVKLADSLFKDNVAGELGGAIFTNYENLVSYTVTEITNCNFTGNHAKEGGAAYTSRVTKVSNSVFIKNNATDGDGGALYINNKCQPEFVSCRFQNNTCHNRGGGIYLDSIESKIKVSYCAFVDNHADKKIYTGSTRYAGHSIFNKGYYDLLDMCWLGMNNPTKDQLSHQFVEYHTGVEDEDHTPAHILKIGMKINETEILAGNDYQVTVYFIGLDTNAHALLHSTGLFYGDGQFSNVKAADRNDMTADVNFTVGSHRIYGKLDYEELNFDINAKSKMATETHITSCENATYPNSAHISFEISHKAEDASYEIRDSEGTLVRQGKLSYDDHLDIETLVPGNYTVTIINPETHDYLGSSDNANFTIFKGQVHFNLTVYDETYPDMVECIVITDAIGDLKCNLTVTGESGIVYSEIVTVYDLSEKDMNSYNVGELLPGTYVANITFLGDGNYDPYSTTVTFNVFREGTNFEIEADPSEINYGDTSIIFHTIAEGATGTIKYYLNNLTFLGELPVGENLTLPILDVGSYTIIANYSGDSIFLPTFDSAHIIIRKALPRFELENVAVDYGVNGTVVHTLPDSATGTIKYYLEDGTFIAELPFNETLTLPVWNAGTYVIIANYSGDKNFLNATAKSALTINKAVPRFGLENVAVDYGVDGTVVHTLPDSATGTITYYLDNGTFIDILAFFETLTLSEWDAGTYVIIANYSGDNNFLNATANSTLTINKVDSTLNVSDISFAYGSTGSVDVSFTGATGIEAKVIGHDEAVVNVKGNKITVSGLNVGSYTLSVSTKADSNHNSVTKTIKVTVKKADSKLTVKNLTLDYGTSTSLTVKTEGTTGITAKINGKKAVVNGNKITIPSLKAGTYTLTVTTIADSNHNSITKTAKITVKKLKTKLIASAVTTRYNANKKLVITLKDIKGKALSGVRVTVKLVGTKTYTTNKKGQVKVPTKGLAVKKYIAKITFKGNANYVKSSKKVKVTVKKAKPKITAKAKAFRLKTKVKKYTIVLKSNNKALKNKKVTLKVKGKKYKATTNSKGKATFKITKLNKIGKYNAVISYKGGKNYLKASKKVKLKVARKIKSTFKTQSNSSSDKYNVKRIQRALKKNGYYLTYDGHYLMIDGIYHQCTRRSVREFQRDHGLKVTGKVDEKTAKKLKII